MPRPPAFDKNRQPITYVVADKPEQEGGERIYLHRFIWGDIPEGYDVRHVNGDTMDNRRSNLELYKLRERKGKRK